MAEGKQESEQPDKQEEMRIALDSFRTDASKLLEEIGQQKATIQQEKDALLKDREELTKAKDEAIQAADKIREFHATLFAKADGKDKPVVEAVSEEVKAITMAKEKIDTLEASATAYVEALLGKTGPDGNPLPSIKADLEEKAKQLSELHSSIFKASDPNQKPLSDQVGTFLEEFSKKKKELEEIEQDIIDYETELLGQKENGERKGGIQSDVAHYIEDLDSLLKNSTARQRELLKEVEKLLAGASTAALGKAFREHKESFIASNKVWMYLFIGSIAFVMIASPLALLIPVDPSHAWWESLLARLSIVGGAVTLAWYASKQRSQNKRLQQEYAYKEDVALIYVALKKELDDLEKVNENSAFARALKVRIMRILANSVGYNPSETLDSKAHDDNGPILKGYEKAIDAFKDVGASFKSPIG